MIKRKMSLLLSAVVVASGVGMATPVFAANAQKQVPAISYATADHTLAIENEPFSFAVEAKGYEGDVQYRIFVQKQGEQWTELTDGYSKPVNAKTPFIPQVNKKLKPGKYVASVWVKRAGQEGIQKNKFGSYDSYMVKTFSIQKPEYFKGRAKLDNLGIKDTYKVGEKVTIKGDSNSKYKLHVYDPSAANRKAGWIMDKTYETAENTSYTFTKPGTYLIDVWGMSNNPSEAVKNVGYGGWTLKVVTVEENKEEDVKVTVTELKDGPIMCKKYVKAKLNVSDPENYRLTFGDDQLSLITDKNGEKVFRGCIKDLENGKLTKESVESKIKIEKINVKPEEVKPETGKTEDKKDEKVANVKSVEITPGMLMFQRTVKVTLDTETPEKYDVTVCGKKLKFVDKNGKKFFRSVVDKTDETEIKENVVVTLK